MVAKKISLQDMVCAKNIRTHQWGLFVNCTEQQNHYNQPLSISNSSGFKGVKYNNRYILKYSAQITKGYKEYYLGRFKTKEEAAMKYDENAIELFGEFAKTNETLGLFT